MKKKMKRTSKKRLGRIIAELEHALHLKTEEARKMGDALEVERWKLARTVEEINRGHVQG